MNAWPLTSKEKMALRKKVLPLIDMEKLVSRYAQNVETTASSIFTHKCTCPSKDHKGGQERTPSFYFSEESRTYKCFGCGLWGDAFDFISLVRSLPADVIVDQYITNNKIDVSALAGEVQQRFDISELNYDMSTKLREHLKAQLDAESYNKERVWVDRTFRRIDERFLKLTNEDYEKARQFYMQILMELERRKL